MSRRSMRVAIALSNAVNYSRILDAGMSIGEVPDVFVATDDSSLLRFSHERYMAGLRTSQYARWIHYRSRLAGWLTSWMSRIPIIGHVLHLFWCAVLDGDGPLPFDALAFGFLNDWCRPTLWHTWQQIRTPHGPYSGIYIHGAPHNKEEAA